MSIQTKREGRILHEHLVRKAIVDANNGDEASWTEFKCDAAKNDADFVSYRYSKRYVFKVVESIVSGPLLRILKTRLTKLSRKQTQICMDGVKSSAIHFGWNIGHTSVIFPQVCKAFIE